jgi:hypothetical protein
VTGYGLRVSELVEERVVYSITSYQFQLTKAYLSGSNPKSPTLYNYGLRLTDLELFMLHAPFSMLSVDEALA